MVGLRAQKTASAGPAEYFDLSSDGGIPAGGERPAALLVPRPQERDRRHTGVGFELVLLGHELVDAPNVVSLPEFQQHSVEHNVDIPVCGGVGQGALHGSVRRDLALLGHVQHRMAMEVMRWFVDPARGFTLTSEEQFSMVRLLPDSRGMATASPGRFTNTGHQSEEGGDGG